ATCKVSVVATPAESIALNHESAQLKVGESVKLEATVLPEDATDKNITWSSSDETVATVDTGGNVTAIALGNAEITASCGTASASCKVTVNPVPATGVILNVKDMTLLVGQSDKLSATVEPEDTTNPAITWSSDNEEVATVSEDGVVTAIAVGEANITATCGEASATCKVTVNPVPATAIILSEEMLELEVEATATLTAQVVPDEATDKTVIWSSSNPGVATVSSTGLVTAVKDGTAIITAQCGEATASCEVIVTEKAGISAIFGDANSQIEVYSVSGLKLEINRVEDLKNLKSGFYIINGKKVFVK
ncbi:MAG: Ig-like domain-containing protein, partial [Muribaculaceae bacterium]|nr:Ig-like domain-containing protein [Muribaculaceae bacterium]